jgi:tetratricopeptide (TPR) repeat protein
VPHADEREQVVATFLDAPLLAFSRWSQCAPPDGDELAALLAREPRFLEIHYHLGLSARAGPPRGGRPTAPPDLDAADDHFRIAYAWRRDWPALTVSIANVAVSAEDFDRAFAFYDETLRLAPGHRAALVGKVRALTYLARHEEAIAATDELLAAGSSPGEARYWRAYNELQLNRLDAAWDDVETADKLMVNADVPKLAGTIALRRRELPVARAKLELARSRRAPGCDTGFYLQAVLSELRDWRAASTIAAETDACFDSEIATVTREIEDLRVSEMPADRRDRQIRRREQDVAADRRMQATTEFNAAAAFFNLQQLADARTFAQKVVDDPQFADRARAILDRLESR